MSLCRLMVSDFMHGIGRPGYNPYGNAQLYDMHDLEKGLLYAEGYIEKGLRTEPFYGFSLRDFAAWCRGKMEKQGKQRRKA